jgi:hypothetical protein
MQIALGLDQNWEVAQNEEVEFCQTQTRSPCFTGRMRVTELHKVKFNITFK